MRFQMLLISLQFLKIQTNHADNTNQPFKLSLYREMPPLFQLEDYDLCKQQYTYCVVYAEIVPNASSPHWQQIAEASKEPKFQYRHDHLIFGVCLESCITSLDELNTNQQILQKDEVLNTDLVKYYNRIHNKSINDNRRFGHIINSCLNRNFFAKYQLRLRTHIEYCERADDELPHDSMDITLYLVMTVSLLLCLLSSFYDRYLRHQQPHSKKSYGNNFFKHDLKTPGHRLLTSFSVVRNYYRILLPSKGRLARDLRFFHGFRVLTVVQVIAAHLIMLSMFIQIENPEFFEQNLTKFDVTYFQNGHVFIQIYFVMSSFLLYVKFMDQQMIKKETNLRNCIAVYIRVFIIRYLRLLPSLLLLILVNATILTRLSDGPLWRHVTEPDRVLCRENWWANVLFINNFFMDDTCSVQTWYLSADTQLFQLYLLIIIVIMKYPQYKKAIYSVVIFSAIAIPTGITYFLKLGPAYHTEPETFRHLFYRNAETILKAYPMFYTNLGGYMMGFVCGEVYLKLRNTGNVNKIKGKFKLSLSFYLVPIIAFAVIFSGYIFVIYDFEKPSIVISIYAGLYKNLWVAMCGACMCCFWLNSGKLFYRFCCLPFFRPLSRISFQSYLWHLIVIRIVGANFRNPVYITRFYLFCCIAQVVLVSTVLAFLMALIFEYPLAEILKYCISQHSKPKTNISNYNTKNKKILSRAAG